MPVLTAVGERFAAERPLEGLRIAACLHVTAETAMLMGALKAGGAEIALAASNPLSTQDDVGRRRCRDYGIAVSRAGRGRPWRPTTGTSTRRSTSGPDLVLDDGCDLVNILHTERTDLLPAVSGGCEETTTGSSGCGRWPPSGALRFPVVAVNDTGTKRMFDNRYGTGQSTLDGIMRATNTLLAGQDRRGRRVRLLRPGRGRAGQGAWARGSSSPRSTRSRRWTPRCRATRCGRWPRPPRSATCSSPSPATAT